jgi:biopolymer transport protein TolR
LPSAAAGSSAAEAAADPTAVTIDADGNLYFKNRQMVAEEIDLELHVLAGKGTTKIVVRGDERVNYGKVVELMNRCKAAGLTEVLLDLRPFAGGVPTPAAVPVSPAF